MELVEEQLPWVAPIPHGRDPNETVLNRIEYSEVELRHAIKSAGGSWQKERKLWRVPLSSVYALGLESRVVEK